MEVKIQPTEFGELDFDNVKHLKAVKSNAIENETKSKKMFFLKRYFWVGNKNFLLCAKLLWYTTIFVLKAKFFSLTFIKHQV